MVVSQTPPDPNPLVTDVAIIGAGPVGLFAIFALGMLGLRCHVIDALSHTGGQLRALYPDKPIYDIPGFPSVLAGDLVDHLERQATPFAPTYHLGQQATACTRTTNGRLYLTTSTGQNIDAGALLIAGGAGAFGPNRPPIDHIQDFEDISVFYAVRDPAQFTDKILVIAGGGDSALDWANTLAPIAQHIYLVHRRDQFRGAPHTLSQLETHVATGKIEKITPYQLAALHGSNGQINTVQVADLQGKTRNLSADALLCFFGLSSHIGPLANFGLALEGDRIMIDPTTAATNVPGIYAAGDICTYPHKLKLIMTGFAECMQAAHAIYAGLNPDRALHHVHSTTRGVPGLSAV